MYPPINYVNVKPDPKYKEIVERRIEVVRKLTDAAFEYLTFDARLTLETFDMPVPEMPAPLSYYTPESLVRAVKERDRIQGQLDQLMESAEQMPENMRVFFDAAVVLPVRGQIEQMEEQISHIQRELEAAGNTQPK